MAARDSIRPPRQARSRATLERALQAGVEILKEGDWEAFTVAEVCRRANVAMGSLYSRFPTKQALLLAVQARLIAEFAEEEQAIFADPSWDALDPPQTIARAVREVGGFFNRHRAALAVLMARGSQDPAIALKGGATARRLGAQLEARLLARAAGIVHPTPERAAEVATRLLLDTLARQVSAPPEFESAIPWDTMVEEMVVVLSSYLLNTASPPVSQN
jgi:AcrR family transcriptional regulator